MFPEQLQDETDRQKATEEDPLKQAARSGRLWKFAEMDERIKDIDKQLESLAALNESESKESHQDSKNEDEL